MITVNFWMRQFSGGSHMLTGRFVAGVFIVLVLVLTVALLVERRR